MMRRMRSDEYGPPDKLNTTRMTFINKNGEEVPVNFSATIIRERGEEVGSVGIFSDLREILKVHQELEAAQAQLVHSDKIASLGRMSAGVAHEINNPLAGILIYAELLQRDLAADAVHRENIEVIINQTMRCQQIVHRLLDFSRQSLGERKLFDVNDIIHRCVELISHQAFFHNIKVIRELDPFLPQIVGDPGQLQQVFTNLLLNAADAMNGQGQITIASRPMRPGRRDHPDLYRHRLRDFPGDPGQDLRTLFYHQTPGQRHGPGAVHRLRRDSAARGDDYRGQPPGRRDHLHHPAAPAGSGPGGGWGSSKRRDAGLRAPWGAGMNLMTAGRGRLRVTGRRRPSGYQL